jgi:hypothetical protein
MMIDFMYLGDYEGTISGDTTYLYLGRSWKEIPVPIWEETLSHKDTRLRTHARMYAMGSKYLCQALKTAAIDKYTRQIEIDPDDFAASINIAYKTGSESDSGMTDCVLDSILRCSKTILSSAAVQTAIDNVAGLSYKLFLKQCSAKPVTTDQDE